MVWVRHVCKTCGSTYFTTEKIIRGKTDVTGRLYDTHFLFCNCCGHAVAIATRPKFLFSMRQIAGFLVGVALGLVIAWAWIKI